MNKVMNARALIMILLSAVTTVGIANSDVNTPVVSRQKVKRVKRERPSPEKIQEMKMKFLGGDLIDRRKQSGIVYIVNSQKTIDDALLDAPLDRFSKEVHVDFKREIGDFDITSPTIKGNATVFIIDSPKLPMSLIALEARWAVVNVSQLKCEKMPFFESRTKKEIFRVLCQLLGVGCSKWPNCITGCITKGEDLDQLTKISFPVEFKERFKAYLPGLGITPWKMSNYQQAVKEGWAPTPTNEYQKAIWDKAHALPKTPMKIEFDPKKGR